MLCRGAPSGPINAAFSPPNSMQCRLQLQKTSSFVYPRLDLSICLAGVFLVRRCMFVLLVMGFSEPHSSAILGSVPKGLLVLLGPPSASGIVTCQRGRLTQWQIFVYKEVNSSDTETHQEPEQWLQAKRQPQKHRYAHKYQNDNSFTVAVKAI